MIWYKFDEKSCSLIDVVVFPTVLQNYRTSANKTENNNLKKKMHDMLQIKKNADAHGQNTNRK